MLTESPRAGKGGSGVDAEGAGDIAPAATVVVDASGGDSTPVAATFTCAPTASAGCEVPLAKSTTGALAGEASADGTTIPTGIGRTVCGAAQFELLFSLARTGGGMFFQST